MRDLADVLVALAKSGYLPRRPFEDEMQNNRVRGDYQLTTDRRRVIDYAFDPFVRRVTASLHER